MRTERKPPLNVRAVQRLYHSRQGDYLAKDDVSISKQVGVVSRFNGNFIDWLQARVFKTAGLDTSRWRKATYDHANQSPPVICSPAPSPWYREESRGSAPAHSVRRFALSTIHAVLLDWTLNLVPEQTRCLPRRRLCWVVPYRPDDLRAPVATLTPQEIPSPNTFVEYHTTCL